MDSGPEGFTDRRLQLVVTMDLCMECEDEELDPWQMADEPAPPSPPKPAAAPPQPEPLAPQPPPLTPAVQPPLTPALQQAAVIAQQHQVLPQPPPLTPSPAVQQMVSSTIYQQPSQGTSQPTYLMPATQPGGQSYYLMPLNVTGVPTLQTMSHTSPVMLQQVPNIVQPPNVTIVPQIIQMSQPAPVPPPAPPTSKIVHIIQNTTPSTTSSASTQLKTFAEQANTNVVKPLYKLVTTSQAPSKTAQVTQPVGNPVQAPRSTSTATTNQETQQVIHHSIARPMRIAQAKPAQTQVHPVKITQAQPKPVVVTTSNVGQVTQAQTKPAVATPGQVQATQSTQLPKSTCAKTSASATPGGTVMTAPSSLPKRRKKGLPPPRVVAKILQDKTVVYVKCTESSSSTNNTTTLTQSKPSDNVQPANVTPATVLPRPVAVHQALQSPSPMAIVNTISSATKVSSLTYTCPLCNNKFFSLASLTAHRQNCKKNISALPSSLSQPSAVASPQSTFKLTPTSAPGKAPSPPKSIQLNISIEEYYYGKKEPNVSPNSTEEKGLCVFKCYTCSKVLKSNIKYMNHIRHHIEHERQQNPDISDVTSCQRCFKRFETPFQLQCHLETMHNTANPDTFCKICEISFKSEKALQSHMLQDHQPCEMPYACKLCGFRSSVLADVESHFRTTHEGTKNLLCTFCLKIIVQCRAFDVHCLKHFRKSDKKKCKSCRLQFHSTSELQQHRKHDHVSFAPAHVIKQHRENAKLNFTFQKKANKMQDTPLVGTSSSAGVTEYGVAGMPRGIKRSLNLTCRPVQDHRTHTCLECGAKVQDLSSHYMKYVSCSKCRYSTCCSRAYADHMICRHQAQGRQRIVSANMFQVDMYTCETGMNLSCGCSYSTTGGREMAEHLQACYFKSCFIMSSPLKINVQSLTGFLRNSQNAGEVHSAKRPRSDTLGRSGVEFVDLTEEEEDDDMAPGSFVCPHCDLHFNLRMPLTQHIKFCGPQQSRGQDDDTYTVSIKQEPEDPIVVVDNDEDMTVDDEDNLKFTTLQVDSPAENEGSEQQSDSEERDEQKEWEASIGLDAPDISSNTVTEHLPAESSSTAEDISEGVNVGVVVKIEKEEVDSLMDLQIPEELHTAEDSGTAADNTSKANSTEISIKVEKEEDNNVEEIINEETVIKKSVSKHLTVDIEQDVTKEPELDEELAEQIQPATEPSMDSCDAAPATEPSMDSCDAAPATEPSMDSGDAAPATEPSMDSCDAAPATEPSMDSSDAAPATEPSMDSCDAAPATEPSMDNSDAAPATEPSMDSSDAAPATEPSMDSCDAAPATEPSMDSSDAAPATEPSMDSSDAAPQEQQETTQAGEESESDVAEQEDKQSANQEYTEVETNTVLDNALVSDDQEHIETVAIKAIQNMAEEYHVEELGCTESTLERPGTEKNLEPGQEISSSAVRQE
ncbi:POGZ [Branchiostoma lanceolatum]|uniref:POGZ protein n=3 Tax=Branchiostoma lanceolatum TaxID=7740 RepID=A0A8J9ZDB1_BRALA|nr:POGZ [Branchiostoma lanceolatum]